jgi:hypothetical protein
MTITGAKELGSYICRFIPISTRNSCQSSIPACMLGLTVEDFDFEGVHDDVRMGETVYYTVEDQVKLLVKAIRGTGEEEEIEKTGH